MRSEAPFFSFVCYLFLSLLSLAFLFSLSPLVCIYLLKTRHNPRAKPAFLLIGSWNTLLFSVFLLSTRFSCFFVRPVLLYSNDVLVREFSSMVEAAQWLNVSRFTLMRHVKSGKVLNGEYIIRLSRKL